MLAGGPGAEEMSHRLISSFIFTLDALGLSNNHFSSVIGYTVYEAAPGTGATFTTIPGPNDFTLAVIFPISTFLVLYF